MTILKLILITIAVLAVLAGLAAGGWYGAGWVQLARADALLGSANDHITNANGLLTSVMTDSLVTQGFTSLESIDRSAAEARSALSTLDEARREIALAAQDSGHARGLALLPAWYRDYLSQKEEVARIRLEQSDSLAQALEALAQLYESGPVIFTAIEEMDRLLGQYETALGEARNSPVEASADLRQISQSMNEVKRQLEAAFAEKSFQPVADMASSVGRNIELVDLTVQLADATAGGDQARVQQAANDLENHLLGLDVGASFLHQWWESQIEPLQDVYDDLQARQEELDDDAAAIYSHERP